MTGYKMAPVCEATHCNQDAEIGCDHCEKDYCEQHMASADDPATEELCCYCGDPKAPGKGELT